MVDFFVTITRFPIALIATPFIIVFFVLLLLVETVLALISFPFVAMIMSRDAIKESWLGGYPNSLRITSDALRNSWQWVFSDVESNGNFVFDFGEVVGRVFWAILCGIVLGAIGYGIDMAFFDGSGIVGAGIGGIFGFSIGFFADY